MSLGYPLRIKCNHIVLIVDVSDVKRLLKKREDAARRDDRYGHAVHLTKETLIQDQLGHNGRKNHLKAWRERVQDQISKFESLRCKKAR